MNKINFYIFGEIFRGFLLILFIFLSIAWLLQFTRLMSISNLLQIDTLSILELSVYLVPNLFTTILPFIIIIGISITFIKLFKDREIITIKKEYGIDDSDFEENYQSTGIISTEEEE